jgi:sulfur-oxidizing protein SoxA
VRCLDIVAASLIARIASLFLCGLCGSALIFSANAEGPQPPKSGIEFQSADVRAMQADDFANPATLWVERGAALWQAPRGERGVSCAACHGDAEKSMKGVAARYPAHVESLGRVVDIEQRINACVVANQKAPAFAWESQELLALTAYVAKKSHGAPVAVRIDGPAARAYERGRHIYFERQGQLNLACTHCHDASWGRTLLADKVSQGQPVDWPAYRLEWQALGSLERRLRACYFGVRAEMPPFGADDLVALELYLAKRAQGLASMAPGVRR